MNSTTADIVGTGEYWHAVVESAGLGVWDYNIVTGEKRYTPRWREIRKLLPSDILPSSDEEWLATVHPDDVATAKHYTEMINSGQADEVAFEYRERGRNGQWIWIMCRGRAFSRDETGRATRFVGIDTDISEMKAAEQARALAAKQVEIAVNIAGIGIWNYNIARNSATWNAQQRRIYGMPDDGIPVVGGFWENCIHPDDRDRATRETEAGSISGEDYDRDYRIVRADGDIRHIRSRISYVPDGVDGPSLVGIDWDVTRDLRQARMLEEAVKMAEQRLAQLTQVQKELEHLSRHDPLTNLPNRRALDEHLKHIATGETVIADRAFLLIDVDDFKKVNDTRGHAYGDGLLQVIADALLGQFSTWGLLVRTGGDEFLAVLETRQLVDDMMRLATESIERTRAVSRSFGYEVTVSIGIDATPATAAEMFANADRAMYRAKRMGGARALLA